MSEPSQAPQSRSRLIFAGVLLAGLLGGVTVLLVAGGSDEVAAADPDCVDLWNEDAGAVSFGRHQESDHGYAAIQVARLDAKGNFVEGEGAGLCAMIFAAQVLDSEPTSAAQIYDDNNWKALINNPGVGTDLVADLQSGATTEANASLTPDGTIVALTN